MHKKKKNILLIIILVSTFFLSNFVYAFCESISTVNNQFKVGNVNVELEENFDSTPWPSLTTKEVNIVNYEDYPCIIRVAYSEIWKYNDDVISNKLLGKNVVIKNWTEAFNNDFIYKDGWYYYNKLLDGNESIKILNSIKLDDSITNGYVEYSEGTYDLTFYFEAVQPTKNAVNDLWGYQIDINDKSISWNFD